MELQVRDSEAQKASTTGDHIRQQMARLLISPELRYDDSSFRLELPPRQDTDAWLEQGWSKAT